LARLTNKNHQCHFTSLGKVTLMARANDRSAKRTGLCRGGGGRRGEGGKETAIFWTHTGELTLAQLGDDRG